MGYFKNWFKGGIPCHVVVQNWVMRYGLYLLKKPVEVRNDWVYILDHTIEFGVKKCLVLLCVSLEKFRENNCQLRHEDMEVLAIDITGSATAGTVLKVLNQAAKITGIPAQIISDNGGNIKRAVEDFIAKWSKKKKVKKTYDVTHKAAIILKHYLKDDKNWTSFVEFACNTKRSLVHTVLSFLAPPRPKDKARWLNMDAYIDWVERVMCLGKSKLSSVEYDKYKDKLMWPKKFKPQIKEWRSILDLLQIMKKIVKADGLSKHTVKDFKEAAKDIELNTTRLKQINTEIIAYLLDECKNLGNEPCPGCSDIIESIFGKYKQFSAKTPMKEVGKAVLTMPVLTSTIDPLEVKGAMESISAKDVDNWLAENIGKSLFAKRKEAYSLLKTKMSVKKNNENLKKVVNF